LGLLGTTTNPAFAGTATFSGGISGSGALTVTGNGLLNLPTANTFTGGFTLNSAVNTLFNQASTFPGDVLTVNVVNNNALGTGPVTLAGATLTSSIALTLPNALLLSSAGSGAGATA